MAQTALQGPNSHRKPPNTADETPGDGWSFKKIVETIDGMFTELYGLLAGTGTLAAVFKNSAGAGAANGAAVSAIEYGDGVIHKTVLTLSATPITLTDDAGVGQYGGVKIYDFPAGNVAVLGASIDADITLNETWWADAAEGDVGLGTTIVTNGDALATTEQNVVATTAIAAMTAQVGPIDAQSSAVLVTGAAGTTDADLDLNIRIDDDAAHMPDIVTNGAFGSDTGWTKGTGWTIAGGKADSDGSQSANSELSQVAAALVAGVTYKVVFTVSNYAAGNVRANIGGTLGTNRASDATFTENIVAGSGGSIALRADLDFVGKIDNVVITPLTGTGTITGTVTVVWTNTGDF